MSFREVCQRNVSCERVIETCRCDLYVFGFMECLSCGGRGKEGSDKSPNCSVRYGILS
jgi:hypothetical protein